MRCGVPQERGEPHDEGDGMKLGGFEICQYS